MKLLIFAILFFEITASNAALASYLPFAGTIRSGYMAPMFLPPEHWMIIVNTRSKFIISRSGRVRGRVVITQYTGEKVTQLSRRSLRGRLYGSVFKRRYSIFATLKFRLDSGDKFKGRVSYDSGRQPKMLVDAKGTFDGGLMSLTTSQVITEPFYR